MQTPSPERLHGGRLGCDSLPTQRLHRAAGSMVEHAHTLGREGIGGGGFDYRRGKAHGYRRIEGIATAEEHAHASHGGQIMAAGHDTMRAPHHGSAGTAYHVCMFRIVLSRHQDSPLSGSLPCLR